MSSTLRCIACDARHEPREVRYRCARCDDLLEVAHDLDRIGREHGGGDALRELFEARLGSRERPYHSGVWRYHEVILPDLPLGDVVSKPEGNTSLYRVEAIERAFDAAELHIKHEGENPTLSFKDRGMTAGVSWAKHLGMARVACASTGDTSAALAAYAAGVDGLDAAVLLPRGKISPEQLAQALAYGATTLAVDGDFDVCMRLVRELSAAHPVYLLNSMNPFRIEGQKAIGLEVIQQLGWRVPDWFVIPVGNAGNVSALGKGLIEAKALGLIDRLPRIAAIQAEAADPFHRSFLGGFRERVTVTARPTAASAIRIGAPVSHDKARRVIERFEGSVVRAVGEDELLEAKTIADRGGVAVCPNSGVALAGLRRLRTEGVIGRAESVVVIATAHGAKFSQVADHGEAANRPRPVAAELDAIVAALGL